MTIDWVHPILVAGGVAAGALVLWSTGHAIKILRAEAREAHRLRVDEARERTTG